MYKFSEEDKSRYDGLKSDLSEAKDDLSDAISEFNDLMRDAWRKVARAQDRLNSTISDANDFREEIVTEMQELYDTLEEGAKGSAEFSSVIDDWAGADISESSVDEPDDLEDEGVDTESFDALSTELEGEEEEEEDD